MDLDEAALGPRSPLVVTPTRPPGSVRRTSNIDTVLVGAHVDDVGANVDQGSAYLDTMLAEISEQRVKDGRYPQMKWSVQWPTR